MKKKLTWKQKDFQKILNEFSTGNEIITSTKISNLSSIQLPAKSAMIIELN